MKKILFQLRQTWDMLGRDIIVGQRYDKNLKSIRDMAVILILAGAVMFVMNVQAKAYLVSLTSVAIILAGIGVYAAIKRRNRKAAMIVTVSAVMLVFTYDILFVTNGFAYMWTMLIPLAISYLFSARTGILVSLYFWIVFLVAFYTPLRSLVENNYAPIVIARFPVLYFFHIVFTGFVMIQYHKSVLDQMDYNEQLNLARENAEQAREAAEQSNRAKSEFLANMSHEIRTPINAVLGMNEMILRESAKALNDPAPDAQSFAFANIKNYAGNIQSAGRNLLSTINDILDFSKIEAGKIELTEGEYRLSSLLNDLSNMVCFRAGEKGIAFQIDVDTSIPDALYGDEIRVRQVITNLLSNAVKYTNQGSVLLKVRYQAETIQIGAPILLTVSVKDSGIGIREEDLGKLFDKFQRVDLEKNSTVEGTGLGLAISRRLMTMMGGEIRVESVYGQGSEFTITFPQKTVSCEPVGDFQAKFEGYLKETNVYLETFRAPDARILIVDDTRMNLSVATGLLRETRMRIDTADSGKEAIALAKDTPYDLILMDQRMPEMDGTEAMRLIRAQKDGCNADTPVICLTADAVIGARERYLAEGFTDYLSKPIDPAVLDKMLIKHLPPEKVERQAAEKAAPSGNDASSQVRDFDFLRQADVEPEMGLDYCQGDGDFYRSLLAEYLHGAEQKRREIQESYDAGDWKNYATLVHALKSTSRMIGARTLSETAAALESAGDKADETAIHLLHPILLAQYQALTETLAAHLGANESVSDTDEILEFMPEE